MDDRREAHRHFRGSEHEQCSTCGYKSGSTRSIPRLKGDAPVISGISDGVSYDGTTKFEVTDPDGDLKSVVAGSTTLVPGEDGKYTLPYGVGMKVVATDNNGNATEVTVSSYEDHDWGAWTSLGGTHERRCSHNGCIIKVETGACSGGKATCSARATCEVCGGAYGETDPNNHVNLGDWERDDCGHWRTCVDCGAAVDEGGHELEDRSDADYVWSECATCGYVTEKTKRSDAGPDKGDKDGSDGGTPRRAERPPCPRPATCSHAALASLLPAASPW